jgi:hypothetical protein
VPPSVTCQDKGKKCLECKGRKEAFGTLILFAKRNGIEVFFEPLPYSDINTRFVCTGGLDQNEFGFGLHLRNPCLRGPCGVPQKTST